MYIHMFVYVLIHKIGLNVHHGMVDKVDIVVSMSNKVE